MRRRLQLLLFFLLLPGILCPRLVAAADAVTDFDQALARREFVAALRIVEERLTEDPEDLEWRLRRAELSARAGQLRDALDQVREICAADAKPRRARIREGQWLSQLGRLASATAVYRRHLEDFPDDPDALTGLGLVHLWQGDYHEAARLFSTVLEEDPRADAAFLGHLRLLMASGKPRQAWREATERDAEGRQQDPELGLVLATIAGRVGAADLAEALGSRPASDLGIARQQATFRAQMRIRSGRVAEGLALLAELAAAPALSYAELLEIGDAYAAADQRKQARVFYEKARQATPERPEARLGLARLASRDGRLAGSLALYQKIVADNAESLEGWLGVIGSARLLDDAVTVRDALEQASQLSPRSAVLHRERLRLALLEGDLPGFESALEQYRQEQPDDGEGRLWALRLAAWRGEPLPPKDGVSWLDPLQPQLTAAACRVWLAAGCDPWAEVSPALRLDDPALDPAARRTLAEWLAVLLQRDSAIAQAQELGPDEAARIRCLAHGWWAYATTPLGHASELANILDAQAIAVWLAAEMDRRLRILHVETESPLWDDWLLARASWFHRWRGAWADPAAVRTLDGLIRSLGQDWAKLIPLARLDEAWRVSEERLATNQMTYGTRIQRARWRLYRRDFAGALGLFAQLEAEYPDAAEPAERQAEVLRAAGRWLEAERRLRPLVLSDQPSVGVRLAYADLLRRLGRLPEAHGQLQALEQAGCTEPEYFLQQTALAEAHGRPETALDWCRRGLERHPASSALHAWRAEWHLRNRHAPRLAEWLKSPGIPARLEPDWVAAAAPFLRGERVQELRASAPWWFSWHWLPWERLPEHSLTTLRQRANDAVEAGSAADAANVLEPALGAGIPDSDFWLQAARLLDLAGRVDESERAFTCAMHLGAGRPDAEILSLTRRARRDPSGVSRELARRLEERPDEQALRLGLVQALLHGGQVGAAQRTLAPLVQLDPDNPEVRMLAAQVRAASGRVRQARSLYASLLRQDPLAADPRAGLQALRDTHELGLTVGYEYDVRSDTSGDDVETPDWQEAFADGFWRLPPNQTFSFGYHVFDRDGDVDHQLPFEWSTRLGRDWLFRLRAAPAVDADYIPQIRAGAGASFRLEDRLWAGLDAHYLHFRDVDVWQVVPAIDWRWHPRGTVEGRLYVSHNRLASGRANESTTFAFSAGWQLGTQSLIVARFAMGDENSANPTADLVGNDQLQSYGIELRLGVRHRWALTPAYRYEMHERFDLHALGVSLGLRY